MAANLLGAEASAYLRSAAHQPVHWLPWSEEAFARARAEQKPILLDIGAVWCHWCHVMDGESYEDPGVAEILNRDFVCIKVDRDERPDVDARYQRAVQALSGQGGWPLTAFLTPDGEVFFGGTYFPPDNNPYGRPGFRRVLTEIARAFREEQDRIASNARVIREHVTQSLNEAKSGAVSADLVSAGADLMARLFDVRYGGFGSAPKFPHPAALEFLLTRMYDAQGGLQWQREIVEKTLTGMAHGGVRDHLGGGFHRYSVDERWIVPHFEKMSYDNSELLRVYLSGYQALGTPLFKEVATGIVDWVLEVMADQEQGAFATSQDADLTFGDDGDYWTWTVEEARSALATREFAVAATVFDIQETGEMHHNPKKNVLWWKQDPAGDDEWPALRSAMHKLKAARDRRPAPFVDRTAYVNWNAMMAAAFLHAGAVLDRDELNTLALKVLGRIWSEAWDDEGGMSHVLGRAEPRGMLDDNVQSAAAFLDAYEATGEASWRERAIAVMHYCDRSHADEGGGYFDLVAGKNGGGTAYLATRAKPVQDAPTPSPNGVAALVLARLWVLTDDAGWRERLDRQLAAVAGSARELSLYGATLFRAMDWAVNPVTRIDVKGPGGDGPACAMHLLALQEYRPRKAVVRSIAPEPAATVCIGTTCSLPAATAEQLKERLHS
ncbi:MAG TPA: thioredoxin domain-containing protein [Gemmatimonadales bacterium]|nr:thioredoxin domain-containing protein [Gemmatimonadales bacterium]